MALIIEDRVQESTTSTGTGNIVVAGAVTAHRTFASVCAIGDTFYGVVMAVNSNGAPTGQWETGLYTYSSANTITRTAIHANSAGTTTAISFSSGTKRVYIDVTATLVKTWTATSNPANAMPFGQDPSQFGALLFQEEFNNSSLNTQMWSNALPGVTSDSNQNFSVSNGSLLAWPTTNFIDRHITTEGKFYFNPGCYIEVKAKMPVGRGASANCWLYINDTATVQYVDICKTHGGGNTTSNPNTAFPGYANTTYNPINVQMRMSDNATGGTTSSMRASDYMTVPDLSLATNTFAIKWESTGITFFLNGVQVNTKISASMTQRMYLTLTMGFDSGNDAPNTTNTPQGQGNSFVVDHVRAWQLA